jgi:protein tyrosine phosphatase (PTP) superfamily phosphohydrolase (DUF442 family)
MKRRVAMGATLMLLAAIGSLSAAPPRRPARAKAPPDSAAVVALLRGMRNASCPLPGVAIGGQPSRDHLGALRKAGFRTVLDLRLPDEARGFDEPHEVKAAGLAYRALPIGHYSLPDTTFDAFRALMGNRASQPVLVHCASGNRVGPVLIAWLVLDCGWDWDRALAEAKRGGLRSEDLEATARDYVARHSSH